jgi:hypothetical protein
MKIQNMKLAFQIISFQLLDNDFAGNIVIFEYTYTLTFNEIL